MANEEQLAILKQGVEVWNKWRNDNPDVEIDLIGAYLKGLHLNKAMLARADLFEANLTEADLSFVNLTGATLARADLIRANLSGADLRNANFSEADLSEANLSDANLVGAVLAGADLTDADLARAKLILSNLKRAILTRAKLRAVDLRKADLADADLRSSNFMYADLLDANLIDVDLKETNLTSAILLKTDFTDCIMGDTILGNNNLDGSFGLDTIMHIGPSVIGVDTIQKSEGKIPIEFLRGCGISDWEIEGMKLYNPDLTNDEITQIQYKVYELRATHALQISPLFISYSHENGEFVDKIESHLNKRGIRFWRDIHDIKSGRIEKQIDRAIRHNPTVLLVLSENSIKSDWVEHEVRTARELEKELGRGTLCPVALDDSWKSSPWPKRVMEQVMEYNILDFSEWEDDVKFGGMFRRLIDGLELFYKG